MEEEMKAMLDQIESLKHSLPNNTAIADLQRHAERIAGLVKCAPTRRSKVKDMSAEVVDSNPYSRLMALQRMGIVHNYERIRDFSVAIVVGMTKTDAAVQTLKDINPDVVLESYSLNITTVKGFEVFMESLTNKNFHGSGVDLVLSCVDNYEARMVVNQACNELKQTWMESGVSEDAVSGHIQLLIPGETACFACAPPLVVASGVDERTLKREGVCAASLPTTMNNLFDAHLIVVETSYNKDDDDNHINQGYNALKDYFPTMEMRPNPQCSNLACLERQKEYDLAKPAREAAAKAKMEAESSSMIEYPVHIDNEWNISVVDDNEADISTSSKSTVSIPDGLVHELPSADGFQKPAFFEESSSIVDDLDDLKKQLEALNAE
ncbi:Ubiquitin-like modifier-activating enzyme 5 [Acorus calamus]|uniref:Ubiquitin-like modifier-activating enzyme 5 n=1 Tax=Acorus calamus TaxID=4465 RepID=A0AAV9CZ66_ACOCL|nr:Ubiquitin-like modifier-activating enzyme 5 [Acorus calamus]